MSKSSFVMAIAMNDPFGAERPSKAKDAAIESADF
jgi:hypothetical protein